MFGLSERAGRHDRQLTFRLFDRNLQVAGVGFFTDAYDIFAINIAATMIGYVYTSTGSLSTNGDLGLKVAVPVGTFCGQL